jgi:hypothetical protein
MNSTLHIFVIAIIIINVSVYINHLQNYQGHKLKYMSARQITLSETEQQQVFKCVCKFVTSSRHVTVVKKWPMPLKFQVYGNHKVKLKFYPEVKWHP